MPGPAALGRLFSSLNGRQLAVGQAGMETPEQLITSPARWSSTLPPTGSWPRQCIRQALDAARLSAADIQSHVACCSMREGIVLYDRNGEAIWACANVDARASREVAELKEIHDYRFESEVYEVSGQTLALQRHAAPAVAGAPPPDIYRKAATITMISDWLAAKLPASAGGRLVKRRHHRHASICSAATGVRRCWIWPGCAPICCRRSETGTLLGAVTEAAAQQRLGLRAGTPVVMGGGDVQLGCLGLGVVRAPGKPRYSAVLLAAGGQPARRCAPIRR